MWTGIHPGGTEAPDDHGPVQVRQAPGGPKATRAAGLEFEWEFIQKGLFLCAD